MRDYNLYRLTRLCAEDKLFHFDVVLPLVAHKPSTLVFLLALVVRNHIRTRYLDVLVLSEVQSTSIELSNTAICSKIRMVT